MSLLSLISNSLTIQPGSYQGQGSGRFYFNAAPGGLDVFVGDNGSWYGNAYQYCPTVAAIVNRKAESFINGTTWILSTSGKAKGKEAFSEQANKLRALLARPNKIQSWSQFEAQLYIYYQIYGYCVILPIVPVGYCNLDATALWIIPPAIIDVEETNKLWFQQENIVKKVTITCGTERAELLWDSLIIIKDSLPSATSQILPQSKLRPLRVPVETVIKGFRAISGGFDNTPLGIIGNDTKDSMSFIPLPAGEKEKIQNSLTGYGLGEGQKKFIVTDANVTWQAINYPIDTLKLPEHTRLAQTAIVDGLGYPFDLLSNEKGTTFTNRKEAIKMLYQDFIIPPAKSIYEQLNNAFDTAKYNIIIDKDFSHIDALQEDKLSKATARKMANEAYTIEYENDLLTRNRWLELNGEDPVPDGDMYYSEWLKANPHVAATRSRTTQTQQIRQ